MAFPIRVSDVMSQPVQTVSPETTASEAASQCDREEVGSAVVIENGTPIGIVTSADFVRLLGRVSEPEARTVREFMSSPVTTVRSDAPLGDAVETMEQGDINRLVVLADETAVGIVSTDDIARVVPQILQRREFGESTETQQYRVYQETAYEHADWNCECICVSEDGVAVGDTVEFSKTISEQDVRTFAAVSGDTNRLHLDAEYAGSTRFGRRIVHGTLVASLISAALARLPGVTIYVSQDLSFLSPVDIGDRVTASCEIVENLDTKKFLLTTDVFDEEGSRVIEGQAVVLIDSPPEPADVAIEALTSE